MCISYTSLIDEQLSEKFSNSYNLFLDYNFFKFYFFINKKYLGIKDTLMFTLNSQFLSKFSFLKVFGREWLIGTSESSLANFLKRSPGMSKKNIVVAYL